MKILKLFVLVVIIGATACEQQQELEPILENDICSSYIPFYEQQDSSAISLSIKCTCQDSFVDLTTKLAPYIDVRTLDFNCNATQFNLIPDMPSVTRLTSDVTTSNVQAFQNLEIYKNKGFTERPISHQLLFLPKLREIALINMMNFPDMIGTKPFDIFKMTFQDTEEKSITLPSNLHTLSNLTELNIRNVELAIFTDFENLVSLENLTLSNVRWVRIPSIPNQWSKLKTLEVAEVDLRGNIPDIFDDMDSLETIYISETPLSTTTQKNICAAPNLKELVFSACELETIPDELGNLTSLTKLIITTDQNSINSSITLPSSVSNLNNLKSVFVSTNSNQFPTALLSLNNTLEFMGIEDNIGFVPSEIGNFTALEILNLRNCGLTKLPIEIKNLANTLDKLYLAGNNFDDEIKAQIESWLPDTDISF